jgi:hypothetical protein
MTRKRQLRRAIGTIIAGPISALIALGASFGAPLSASADTWRPVPGTSWQWQLQGTIDTNVDADVFDIDMDQSASVVADLHARGKKVICYVNVGAWESYRSDAARFPTFVLGNVYDGYPNERWLDIRQISVLAPIMRERFDNCSQKGFDAVEPDNVDGYSQDSGFPLTYEQQLAYNLWIAAEVHARGMAVGLKNDTDQAVDLQPSFDFAVSEQCFQYQECDSWLTFLIAGKAVFEAEYSLDTSLFCGLATEMGVSAMLKHTSLDSWRVPCTWPEAPRMNRRGATISDSPAPQLDMEPENRSESHPDF